MRFTEQMIGERGAIVRLVQQGQWTQREAARELGVSERQVRRWLRRVEAAGGAVDALRYHRDHPAPNRLAAEVREAVAALATEHPRWSAPAVWEAVEAQGLEPLPSVRTVGRWLAAARPAQAPRRTKPARRFEAPGPLDLVQMDTTSGQWLAGAQMAYVIALLDDYSRAILAARAVAADSTPHNLAVL